MGLEKKNNTKCNMREGGSKNAFMSDVLFKYPLLDLYETQLRNFARKYIRYSIEFHILSTKVWQIPQISIFLF